MVNDTFENFLYEERHNRLNELACMFGKAKCPQSQQEALIRICGFFVIQISLVHNLPDLFTQRGMEELWVRCQTTALYKHLETTF